VITILEVAVSSPAARAGIQPGEKIVSVNQEPVLDEIDYQALIQHPHLEVVLQSADGKQRTVSVARSAWEPLGLRLDETEAMKPRQCRNHCLFCFIDQMPPGMRDTLYVKDDDWRLSLMMGNFVTLTNVDDKEFVRILARRASPLYISVHATDGEVRTRLLRNPHAAEIMDRLTALKNHGLQFHGQVVLCPGINDGKVLEQTVEDLASLWPSALSLAIVPIGMTKYREKLAQIPAVTPAHAEELIDLIEGYQRRFLEEFGTRFVFLSDEFYCLASRDLPPVEEYEDYPQIENGVGLIRQLEEECAEFWPDFEPLRVKPHDPVRFLIPTGVSARPHLERLTLRYAPPWAQVEVIAVPNRFFGESITVTGLIVGRDLVYAVQGKDFDRILISESMLRENTECFLDDMTLSEVRREIGKPIRVVENHGDAFLRSLFDLEDET